MVGKAGVVIIGGGQAAARAAKAIRSGGFDRPITIFGEEAHLPYERPTLSKAMLLQPDAPVPFVFGERELAEAGIAVRRHCRVVGIDRERREIEAADGTRTPYERLLIATGSRVRSLAIPGVAENDILTLRSLDDSRLLRQRLLRRPDLAVIGGGFIGLQVAASAAALGCRVTVVEAAERLLPRLGCPEASAMVLVHHRAQGIDVHLGSTVERGGEGRLHLSGGAVVPATLVVAGIGVTPETGLAEAAGLAVEDGILIDAFGATSDPAIYAAGDVARQLHPLLGRRLRLESWQSANAQAEAAGRTIAGLPTANTEIPWLWSDQGDLNLQVAGAPARVDRVVLRGDPAGSAGLTIFQFEGERLVGGVSLNRGREMPLIRRLLAHPELLLDAQALADPDIPLRRLMPAREAA